MILHRKNTPLTCLFLLVGTLMLLPLTEEAQRMNHRAPGTDGRTASRPAPSANKATPATGRAPSTAAVVQQIHSGAEPVVIQQNVTNNYYYEKGPGGYKVVSPTAGAVVQNLLEMTVYLLFL